MKANEIMQQAKQQAHGEIVKMNVDVSRECDMIVEQAMTNLDKAVEFIVGRIVNFKWHVITSYSIHYTKLYEICRAYCYGTWR